MNLIKSITCILILFFFVFSCKKAEERHVNFYDLEKESFLSSEINEVKIDSSFPSEVVKIPELNKKTISKLSNIIDSIEMIKLETKEECLIGTIKSIKIYDNFIFVLDSRTTKNLYQFDFQGKFIKKIGTYGKGPGEYLNPVSFEINEKEGQVIIGDTDLSKLIYYDLASGNFIKDLRVGLFFSDFTISDDQGFLFKQVKSKNSFLGEIENATIVKTNSLGQVESKFLSYDLDKKAKFRVVAKQSFIKNNNHLLFSKCMENTIYSINKEKILPLFRIELGDRALPKDFDDDLTLKKFSEKFKNKTSKYIFFEGEYQLADDLLTFYLSDSKGDKFLCIYSLDSKEIKISHLILGDLKRGFGSLIPKGQYKNFLITYNHSYEIFENRDYYIKNADVETKRIIMNTKENDNPIIVLQKLKKF